MSTEPLIFTAMGNVPERSLRYEHEWEDKPEMLVFHERWFDIESGQLVKNNMHGYVKKGLVLGAEQAAM